MWIRFLRNRLFSWTAQSVPTIDHPNVSLLPLCPHNFRISQGPQRFDPGSLFLDDRQAAMDPHLVTAFSPFRFLDLPKELRNDIYEAAIFDLSPPDIFITPEETERPKLRKMSTGVLLLNRQVYREARDVIVRRGQLILVSVSAQRFADCLPELSMALSGITGIDPMHRNLCVMSHRSMYQIPRLHR